MNFKVFVKKKQNQLYCLLFLLINSIVIVNCFILSIILLALTLSAGDDVIARAVSSSSIVKFEVKNVGK